MVWREAPQFSARERAAELDGGRLRGGRAALGLDVEAAQSRRPEGVAEQAQALGPHAGAEVERRHRDDAYRDGHLGVAQRPGDARGTRRGEQRSGDEQRGLAAQADQVALDDRAVAPP